MPVIEFIVDGKPKCVGPSRRVLWSTVRGRERHAGWGGRDGWSPGPAGSVGPMPSPPSQKKPYGWVKGTSD